MCSDLSRSSSEADKVAVFIMDERACVKNNEDTHSECHARRYLYNEQVKKHDDMSTRQLFKCTKRTSKQNSKDYGQQNVKNHGSQRKQQIRIHIRTEQTGSEESNSDYRRKHTTNKAYLVWISSCIPIFCRFTLEPEKTHISSTNTNKVT